MKPYRIIRINGVLYETFLKDAEEVFLPNRITKVLFDTHSSFDISNICMMVDNGCFSLDELVSFYAARGWALEQLPDEIYEQLEIEEVTPEVGLSSPMEFRVKELLVDFAKIGLLDIKNRRLSPSSRDNHIEGLLADIETRAETLGLDYFEILAILAIAVENAKAA